MTIQQRYSGPNTDLAGFKFVVSTVEELDASGRPRGHRQSRGFDTFPEAARAFLAVTPSDAHMVVLDKLTRQGMHKFDPLARRVGQAQEALGTYRGKTVFDVE